MDEIRGMLTLKKTQVEQTIHEEIIRLRTIESRLKHIESGGQMDEYDVVLKSIPAQPFLSVRDTFPSIPDAINLRETMQQILPNHVSSKALGHLTLVIHDEEFDTKDIDLEMGFAVNETADFTITLPGERVMTVRELPPIATAATVVRVGGFDVGPPCYAALGTWIEANNYRLSGRPREVILSPPTREDFSDVVMEIQYPIETVEGSVPLLP